VGHEKSSPGNEYASDTYSGIAKDYLYFEKEDPAAGEISGNWKAKKEKTMQLHKSFTIRELNSTTKVGLQ
jgi:hypothetical protein